MRFTLKALSKVTYLTLCVGALIVTVWRCTKRSAWRTIATSADSSPLCEVLFSLLLADLYLLLFAAPTELIRLEGALRFEVGAAMLGDVALCHRCSEPLEDVLKGLVRNPTTKGSMWSERGVCVDYQSWARVGCTKSSQGAVKLTL